MHSIKSLFDITLSLDGSASKTPDVVAQTFSIYPEKILACFDYFENSIDDDVIKNKKSQLSLFFIEAFANLRYKVDNQDVQAQTILGRLHEKLKQDFQVMSMDKQMIVMHALHDSKLPTPEFDLNSAIIAPSILEEMPDVGPKLPALLDQMRREGGLNTPFKIFDFFIAYIQLQPLEVQCDLINELVTAKNTFIQDVGVLMLLHPKKAIRQMVPLIWMDNFANNATQVSPISLRRFIVIRNWLPHDEQASIDSLIQQIRKKRIMPAPHPASKITKLIASTVDGAGVQFFLFETKVKNQRTVAGFLVKEGIGIRDPFVVNKAHTDEFSNILESYNAPSKSVSTSYMSKLVAHFISVGQQKNHVPEPSFLEIAELFGVQQWLPQPIDYMAEINRIKEKENIDTSDPALIERALNISALWIETFDFAGSWFETGDRVNNVMIKASEIHSKMKVSDYDTLPKIITRELMKGDLLNKWIFTFIRMLLWQRSKSIKSDTWKYFLVIAEMLLKGYPVEDIPLMGEMTKRSVAHSIQWQRS